MGAFNIGAANDMLQKAASSTTSYPTVTANPSAFGTWLGTNFGTPTSSNSNSPLNQTGGAFGAYNQQAASSPTSQTPSTATSGLRDMSGQMFAGRQIPQGWSMDSNGNWVNTGASTGGVGSNGVLVGSAPASTVTTSFDPARTAAGLRAGGWIQNADGTWSLYNNDPSSSIYQQYAAGPNYGQAQTASNPLTQTPQPTTPGLSNGVMTAQQQVAQNANPNSNAINALQFLLGLGGGIGAQSWNRAQTPLGYTQYQSMFPSGVDGNSLMNMLILQQLFGGMFNRPQNLQGGNQGSFWNLLGLGG